MAAIPNQQRAMKRILASTIAVALSVAAHAQTVYEWTDGGGNNSWNNSNNWTGGLGVPDGTGHSAWFNDARSAGRKAYVTNEGGDIGTARNLHTLKVTGTTSSHAWQIFANQGEASNSAISVTLHNGLDTSLSGGSSLDLYFALNIASGATVTWNSSGNLVVLHEPLTGCGSLDGDITAGGGIHLTKNGSYSGTIFTGSNYVTIDTTNALQNARLTLEDTNTYLFTYVDGSNVGAIAGSGILRLIYGALNVGGKNTSDTYSGNIYGAGTLTKNGTGTWTVGGTSTRTGATVINGGKLKLTNATWLNNSATTINLNDGLDLSSLSSQTVSLASLTGSGNLNLGTNTLEVTAGTAGIATYTGALSGTGGSLKVNGGVFKTSGAGSFTGTTTLTNAGTLQVGSASQWQSFLGNVAMSGGSTLALQGSTQKINSLTTTGNANRISLLGTSDLTLGETNANIDFGGWWDATATSMLRKKGTGTLTLWKTLADGYSTFQGDLSVDAGVLRLGNGTDPARVAFEGDIVNNASIVIDAGGASLAANTNFGLACATMTGTGSVTYQSGDTVILNSSQPLAYTGGTYLNGGGVYVEAATQLGSGSIYFNGGVLGINSTAVTSTGPFPNTFVFGSSNVIVDTHLAGVNLLWQELMSHAGGFEKRGPGTVIFNQSHGYAGGTLISQGTLQLGNGGSNGIIGHDESITNNGTLKFAYGVFDRTFGGNVAGTGNLVQAGSTVLTISDINTYSGGTIVQSGTLRVDNTAGNRIGSGAVTVQSGGTLELLGTVPAGLTVAGTVNPGNSIGAMTVQGNASLTGTYRCEVSGAAADFIQVNGNVTATGAVIDFSQLSAPTAPVYIILSYTGTRTGNFTATNLPAGYKLVHGYNNGSNTRNIALVTTAAPTVTSITPVQSNPTNAGTVQFTVTFDRPVFGFSDNADYAFVTTGTVSKTGQNFTGTSGSSVYTVSATGVTGDGTLAATILASGGIQDGSGTLLAGDVTGDPITIDHTRPTATITASTTSPTNGTTGVFSIDFSEPVDAVDVADLVVTFTGTSRGTPVISGGPQHWTVTVPDVNGTGTLTLALVNPSSIADLAGNLFQGNPAAANIAFNAIRTWISDAGTLWGEAANWLDNAVGGVGDNVFFGQSSSAANVVVDLQTARTILSLHFQGDANYTLQNNALTLTQGVLQSSGSGAFSIESDLALGVNGAFDLAAPVRIVGVISGTQSIVKTGVGTLTLTGANTLTGSITVSAGTLKIGDSGTSGSLSGNLINNSAVVFDRADDSSLPGTLTGTGGITKQGAGMLTLGTASNFAGQVTVNAGKIALGTTNLGKAAVTVNIDNGIVPDNGGNVTVGALSGSGDLALSGTLTTGGGGGNSDYSGDLSGTGKIIHGTTTLRLSGNNTLTGNNRIRTGGSVILASSQATGTGQWLLDLGTTLQVDIDSPDLVVTNLSGSGTFNVGANQAKIVSKGFYGWDGDIQGTNTINFTTGSGSTHLQSANSFSGTAIISGHTVGIDHTNALALATVQKDGGTISYAVTDATFGALAGTSSFALPTGTLTVGGKNVDSAFSGVLSGSGQLTKTGTGRLALNGLNTFTGTTTVQTGTLGGTGTLAGPLVVDAGATLSPGNSVGTFTVNNSVTLNGSYVCELSGASADRLNVTGNMNVTSATLDLRAIGAGATAPVYIIAAYGTLTGTFATVTGLPAGYSLDYAYNDGSSIDNIALVRPLNSFETWAQARGLTLGANDGPLDDPDGDGRPNLIEFARDGDPLSAVDDGKHREAMIDVSGTSHFAMTIPVRSGAEFSGSPSPSSTIDGITCTFQGTLDLVTWDQVVFEATPPDSAGLPALSSGWTYRTFFLNSTSLTGGFLRGVVQTTP